MKTQKRRFLVKRPHKMSITKTKDLIRIFNKKFWTETLPYFSWMAVEETGTCMCSYKYVSWSGHVLKTMTVEM